MKTYLVIETQNTGGYPPTGSTFAEDFSAYLNEKLKDETFRQAFRHSDGGHYSDNEIVRIRVLEVEVPV